MKTSIFALVVSLVASSDVRADGIPFDRQTGRVTEPHTRIALSDVQRTEHAQNRKITLTDAQHKKLTKLCPEFPAAITEVLSHRYGDCTCCVGRPYAILLPDGSSIAIPHSEANFVARYGVRGGRLVPPMETTRPSSRWSRFWNGIFHRGQS